MTDVYLGGKFVGTVDEPQKFVDYLKEQRRTGLLSREVNVYHNVEVAEGKVEA